MAERDDCPALAEPLPEPSGYDAVLLGYPIWNGRPPMVVQGLLRATGLDGVRLLPFCTHGGSGFGDSPAVLRGLCPGARIEPGLAEYGTSVLERPDRARARALAWLRGAGLA